MDIIEQVNGPTSWVNPIVAVPKKDNKIRLCLDMRRANEAIIRERHIIPKVEDILTELHGAKYFSKLDLREGYHQLELHPDCRDITTFATHKGLFRYKRLIYGVSSAFESFQRQIEIVIAGCPGAKNISDDILVWGTTEEEHNSRLNQVLARLRKAGLKVNKDKCMFCTDNLVFAGHELSPMGISPQKGRIDSIMKMPPPTTATGVRSFLGMTNFCKQYIPHYSTITAPLRLLTKKNQRLTWDAAQQSAFDQLKSSLVSAQVMAFYNPNADTKLIVDGSPIGLGAILTQEQDDGTWRPIAYGSHALDPVQQRYGQTEREALAVTFFCQHFHHYLYDREFTILTDHKPLIHIFAANSDPPPRIQRWMLRLQAYQFNIQHIPGTDMISDYLSRQPLHCLNSDTSAEDFINMIAHNAIPLSCSIGQIARATKADDILQKVVSAIASGQWADKSNLPKTFYQIRHQLSLKDDILLKGNLIVIPTKLQDRILQLAHAQPQGISKTKSLLREKVWWPTINTDVESMIASCHTCQVTAPSSLNYQPLKMSEIPKSCWHTLAVDIQGPYPTGEHILLLIDYRSRYSVATLLKTITSTTVVSSLHKVFTMFGYPKRICTDNGPQFISRQFTAYLESHAMSIDE